MFSILIVLVTFEMGLTNFLLRDAFFLSVVKSIIIIISIVRGSCHECLLILRYNGTLQAARDWLHFCIPSCHPHYYLMPQSLVTGYIQGGEGGILLLLASSLNHWNDHTSPITTFSQGVSLCLCGVTTPQLFLVTQTAVCLPVKQYFKQ